MKGIVTGTDILVENDTLVSVHDLYNYNIPYTVYGGEIFNVSPFTSDTYYEINNECFVGDVSVLFGDQLIKVCDHPDVVIHQSNVEAFDVDVESKLIVTGNDLIIVLDAELEDDVLFKAIIVDQQLELARSWKKQNKLNTFRGNNTWVA